MNASDDSDTSHYARKEADAAHVVSVEEIKQFLQDNQDMQTILEGDFDAWTPRGHAAAEAIHALQLWPRLEREWLDRGRR